MTTNEQNSIADNAITLIDAQDRISDWQNTMRDLFGTAPLDTPQSILIPLEDLQNIVTGFLALQTQYTITGARLYLTFSPPGSNYISGVLVPVGYPIGPVIEDSKDIIVDVNTGSSTNIGPDTLISAYDFTRPCPPLGDCQGASPLLRQ